MDCAASLDVMELRKLVTEERYHRGRFAHENDLIVKGGVHLAVAVAVKVHDHDDDDDHVNAN